MLSEYCNQRCDDVALSLAWWHLHNQRLRSSIRDLSEDGVNDCKLVVVDWHLLELHHVSNLFNSLFCSLGVIRKLHYSKAILYTFGILVFDAEPGLLHLISE